MIRSWQQAIDQQFKANTRNTANSTRRIPRQRGEKCHKPLLACLSTLRASQYMATTRQYQQREDNTASLARAKGNQDRLFQDRLLQATSTPIHKTYPQQTKPRNTLPSRRIGRPYGYVCFLCLFRVGQSFSLSDDEQRVTTDSALLGDLFQKHVSYILFFSHPKFLNEEQNVTSFSSLEGSLT
jgi:hypothetical protein